MVFPSAWDLPAIEEAAEARHVLYAETLGGFALRWEDRVIPRKTRRVPTQFNQVMQALIHNRETGVGSDELIDLLFQKGQVTDPVHCLRSVIYNIKQKLLREGLPDVNLIRLENDRYYWSRSIPVSEDADEFESLCRLSEAETDEGEKLSLLLRAVYLYGGRFLPEQAGVAWADEEAARYHQMFCRCAAAAAELLRKKKDFAELVRVGRHAACADPLHEWEKLTVEGLLAQGEFASAKKIYRETIELYQREAGQLPSNEFVALLEECGRDELVFASFLDDIREAEQTGGLLCSYSEFRGVYRMMRRMSKRSGQPVQLMLCQAADAEGEQLKETEITAAVSDDIQQVVIGSVRHTDAVTKYAEGQFLTMLVNASAEDCAYIQQRIRKRLRQAEVRFSLSYSQE